MYLSVLLGILALPFFLMKLKVTSVPNHFFYKPTPYPWRKSPHPSNSSKKLRHLFRFGLQAAFQFLGTMYGHMAPIGEDEVGQADELMVDAGLEIVGVGFRTTAHVLASLGMAFYQIIIGADGERELNHNGSIINDIKGVGLFVEI